MFEYKTSTLCCRNKTAFFSNLACLRRAPQRQRVYVSVRLTAQSETDPIRQAADFVLDSYVRSNSVLGIGSGPISAAVVERLAARLSDGQLKGVRCVPASDVAAVEAAVNALPLLDLDTVAQIDVTVLDVDQLHPHEGELAIIVGRRGEGAEGPQPQLHRIPPLASKSLQLIALLQDPNQVVNRLRGPIPVVIREEEWEEPAEELDDIFLGDAEIWRRAAFGMANPRGGDHPYVSPEGYTILDIRFGARTEEGDFTESTVKLFGKDAPYREIVQEIAGVEGVVAVGLLCDTATAAVVADYNGPLVYTKPTAKVESGAP
eukprot:jgi/Botrbrau1/21074/Bobra.0144s0073.1